mmetsp:Transcript_10366/g.34569  ORF Transcript_10366/g.34569 Transcript_10366/m.34569 type:complete len:130 (-) Transcript_10366:90-479(-)
MTLSLSNVVPPAPPVQVGQNFQKERVKVKKVERGPRSEALNLERNLNLLLLHMLGVLFLFAAHQLQSYLGQRSTDLKCRADHRDRQSNHNNPSNARHAERKSYQYMEFVANYLHLPNNLPVSVTGVMSP